MDLLTRDALKALIARRAGPCISIYLPTHRAGPDIQQDPIRLKNLVRDALESPGAQAFRPVELSELTKPALALVNDSTFWHEQGDGLALFCAPGFFRAFGVARAFSESAVLADRFHINPLLPELTSDSRFWLLALSRNSARLYHASRRHMNETSLGGLSERPTGAPHGEKTGTGRDGSGQKEQVAAFFREIDQAVVRLVRTDRAPLILAGLAAELALYRTVNSYPGLLEAAVTGNPDSVTPSDLREKAWALLGPHVEKARHAAESKFHELAGTSSATNELGAALPAAHEGRLESLFVAAGVRQWGRFDPITYVTHLRDAQWEGDEDLLDLATIQTLLHHGRVYIVAPDAVPCHRAGAVMAAVFRY